MKSQLTPLEQPFPSEISRVFERYPHRDGYILRLFRVFANSVRFLTNKGVVNLLDKDSPLSLIEREIVILRVCANNDCEYELGVHVAVFAKAAGLTQEQVAASRTGNHTSDCWSVDESLLIEVVDEICRYGKIQDGTYERFQEQWTVEQQLEILALCGNYHTISFVANTSRIPGESFAAKFPHGRVRGCLLATAES
ncbi:MAG: carboxymuconolactone decarboxylase family protein [Nitrososphaerales archaeon]